VRLPEYATAAFETHLPKLVGTVAAVSDFTPSSGLLADFGPVARGTVLPANAPHVRAFPSLFAPADGHTGSGASDIRCSGCSRLVAKRLRPDAGGIEVKCVRCGVLTAA
jgi:hypothetical protein